MTPEEFLQRWGRGEYERSTNFVKDLKLVLDLAIAAEREACAKIAEKTCNAAASADGKCCGFGWAQEAIARAIRSQVR